MLYVCVRDVMDVVFSVCIVTRGAVGARVWEVRVFRHEDVLCLCLVFSMTCSLLMVVKDARSNHIEETYSRAGGMTTL